ncbi:MAG: hypothetical protein AB8B66_03645 [Rickettsiaceae bacterium]
MPLLIALSLFGVGSLITIRSDNFDIVLIGRILQGLGSGGCFTLGKAILADVLQKEKAINALNRINILVPFSVVSTSAQPIFDNISNDTKIGLKYFRGNGVEQNYNKAIEYFKKSMDKRRYNRLFVFRIYD